MARYVDEASTQYRNSTRKSAQLDSLASTTVAAPAPISAQGCSVGARPMANHGDMLSTCSCHLGGFFGGLGLFLRRMCRIATATRPTPMAILTASAPMDGAVFGLGGLLPVASTVTATTMARDTSHPNTNAAPFRTPRFDGSTTRNAVSGNGSSAIPRPIRTRSSATAFPPVPPTCLSSSARLRRPSRGAGNRCPAGRERSSFSCLWRGSDGDGHGRGVGGLGGHCCLGAEPSMVGYLPAAALPSLHLQAVRPVNGSVTAVPSQVTSMP